MSTFSPWMEELTKAGQSAAFLVADLHRCHYDACAANPLLAALVAVELAKAREIFDRLSYLESLVKEGA